MSAKARFDTAFLHFILRLCLVGDCSLEEDEIGVRPPPAARGHLIHAVVDPLLVVVGEHVPLLENVERRSEHRRAICSGKLQ